MTKSGLNQGMTTVYANHELHGAYCQVARQPGPVHDLAALLVFLDARSCHLGASPPPPPPINQGGWRMAQAHAGWFAASETRSE